MALYCGSDQPGFQQNVCAKELGRITAVAYIRSDNTTLSGYTTANEWINGVANGTIHIIKNVRGEKPKSTVISGDGFGLQKTYNVGRDFTATYEHPDVINNEDFYNALNYNNSFRFAYHTQGNKVWVGGSELCTVDADYVIVNTLDSIILFNVTVTWSAQSMPVAYNAPAGVFTA